MARPTKQGLDYFPFDVGFFADDDRIRNLKLRHHANGLIVYIRILCDVYKEGYYLPVKCWEDYVLGLADEFKMSVNAVEQVITFLRTRALLRIFRKGKDDLSGFDGDAVITSHGIQLRYAEAVKDNRKRGLEEVRRDFWLLSNEEEAKIFTSCKSRNNENKSEIKPNKSEIKPNKSEINPTKESKVNESKLNEINVNETITLNPTKSDDIDNCTYAQGKNGESEELLPRSWVERNQEAKRCFFKTYPALKESAKGVDDSQIDYIKLDAAFSRSKKHLQKWHSFPWIVAHYLEIIDGKYDDYPETPSSASKSASTLPTLPPAVQEANAKADRERFYALRKNKAMNIADANFQKALKSSVEFACAEQELQKMQVQLAKAEINDDVDLLKELKEKEAALNLARLFGLKKLNMTEKDLEPQWQCQKCSDTGALPNGRACDCYQKEKEKTK